jgi:hypothetical protein
MKSTSIDLCFFLGHDFYKFQSVDVSSIQNKQSNIASLLSRFISLIQLCVHTRLILNTLPPKHKATLIIKNSFTMGELFEALLGVAARSVVRHAVVGVLTCGIGNAVMLIGDAMDLHDSLDAMDTVSAVHSHSSTLHFGGGQGDDGKWLDSTSGVSCIHESQRSQTNSHAVEMG